VLAAKSIGYFLGDRAGYAVADVIFTPTRMLADQLCAQGLRASHCPPPVQVATSSRAARDGSSEIRLLAVSGDLSHPRKNLRHVLLAAGHLARSDANRTIVCEMVGRNADALRSAASTLPPNVRVEFPGPLERTVVHQRMRNADALVFPSLYEEWGYVAVEALLLGTPVVTYPVYPFADMLAGGLGSTAEGSQPEQLARAIGHAVSSTNRGELAARAAERYGTPAIGRRLTELWLSADRAP
jgi:glycosyltransferase involved in cell wall biosynthesis